MIKAIFDTHIYDALEKQEHIARLDLLRKLIAADLIQVLMPHTIFRELQARPQGVPSAFSFTATSDGVLVPGLSIIGVSRISDGAIFTPHLGDSKKANDAVIAQTAALDADIFVSDDNRCRERLTQLATKCECMTFEQFGGWLTAGPTGKSTDKSGL